MTTTAPFELTVAGDAVPEPRPDSLDALLHPLDPATFLGSYWQRQPLHLTGWSGRFGGLFDLGAFRRAVLRQYEVGLLIRASTDHVGNTGAGASAHEPIDATDILDRLQAGSSVCVDPIDKADERLAHLAGSLKQQIGHPGRVSVKCYLSPDGYGFHTHFDAHVVMTLQIEGRKRWRVSPRPGVPFPVDNAFLDASGAVRYIGRSPSSLREWERPTIDESEFAEVVLEPGDVLCLPAGTWHNAKAIEHSLALNVSFDPLDPLALLEALLRPRLEENEAWRAGVPAIGSRPDVGGYLAERVRELADALASLDLTGPEVDAALAAAVAGDGAQPPGHAPAAVRAAAPPLPRNGAETGARGAAGATGDMQCLLTVSDARAAAGWYERVLGCAVESSVPEFGWVELRTPIPGTNLCLSEVPTPGVAGGAVLSFGVRDVDGLPSRLEAAGARSVQQPRPVSGGTRVVLAEDPDGNRLVFYQLGAQAGTTGAT